MVREARGRRESAWRGRLAKFGQSRLTVAEFCRQERVSQASFYHWRRRLERPAPKPDRRSSHGPRKRDKVGPFVALSVSSLAIAEIEFRNGVRVRIPARDAEALRIVLRTGSDVCQEVR
jgi:hypothetical protein